MPDKSKYLTLLESLSQAYRRAQITKEQKNQLSLLARKAMADKTFAPVLKVRMEEFGLHEMLAEMN